MPKHPIIPTFYPSKPRTSSVRYIRKPRLPARCWRKKVFVTATISTSSTAGQRLSVTSTACAPFVKVGWWKWQKGSLRRAIFRPAWSPMKLSPFPRGAGAYRSGNRAFDFNRRTTGCPQMPRRGSRSSGAPVRRGENSMTLWINGDWITGQGASRVKVIRYRARRYGKAMMPMPLRSSRLVGQPVRRFRAGRGSHLLNVRSLLNALPDCWKGISARPDLAP